MASNPDETPVTTRDSFLIAGMVGVFSVLFYLNRDTGNTKNNRIFKLPDYLDPFEKFMNTPLIFSFIVLMQGLFGGKGLVSTPSNVEEFFQNSWVRMFSIVAIAYTATGEIEIAFAAAVLFLLFMQYMRTPEERKETPYLI